MSTMNTLNRVWCRYVKTKLTYHNSKLQENLKKKQKNHESSQRT